MLKLLKNKTILRFFPFFSWIEDLKDVKIYRDKLNEVGIMAYPLEYHSPKIPGLGDVDWRGFFSALTSVKYRGPVCIEVEDKAFEGSEEDIKSLLQVYD